MFKPWVLCNSGGSGTTACMGKRFFKLNERFWANLKRLSAVPDANLSTSLPSDESEFESL